MFTTPKDSGFIKSNGLIIKLFNDQLEIIDKEEKKGKISIANNYLIFILNNEIHAFDSIEKLKIYLKTGISDLIYKVNELKLNSIFINENKKNLFGFLENKFIKINKNTETLNMEIIKEFNKKPIFSYKNNKLFFIEKTELKSINLETNEENISIKNIKYKEKQISCFDFFNEENLILALKSNKIVFNENIFHFHSSLIQFIKKDDNSIISISNKLYITTGENSLSIELVPNNINYKIFNCLITKKNIIINSNKGTFIYSKLEGKLIFNKNKIVFY